MHIIAGVLQQTRLFDPADLTEQRKSLLGLSENRSGYPI